MGSCTQSFPIFDNGTNYPKANTTLQFVIISFCSLMQNATLEAERQALQAQLKQLESQSDSQQAQVLALQRQAASMQENNTALQTHNATLQVSLQYTLVSVTEFT